MARGAPPTQPDEAIGPPTRFDPAIYALLIGILAVMLAFLPATLASLSQTLFGRTDVVYRFPGGQPAAPGESSTNLEDASVFNIALTELDETDHTIMAAVSGRRSCVQGCEDGLEITLVSYELTSGVLRGVGQQATFDAPDSRRAFSVTELLPVEGWPGIYPFDTYHIRLGVDAALVADGRRSSLRPEQAATARITVQNATYDLTMEPPRAVPLDQIGDPEDDLEPLGALDITFERPLHLRVLSVALFTMMAVSTVLGLFSRSLPAVVFGNAGLLLGIFSIRSVLVPASIAVVTAIDVACQLLILLMLVGLTARIAMIIRQRSGLPALPGMPRRRA